jgi:hypothetical protein
MENIHTGTLSPLCLDMRAYLRLYRQIAQNTNAHPCQRNPATKNAIFCFATPP